MRKIDLMAAITAVSDQPAVDLTLADLTSAWLTASPNDCAWRLRKWIQAFGHLCAWHITSEQLDTAVQAMLEHGYKPSTVSRDIMTLASIYKWAKGRRLSPRGFISPTRGVRRIESEVRRVHVDPEKIEALRRLSLAWPNRRFGAFVALLIDTGARKSELLERRWADLDLETCTIHCARTKNGTPRVLHFRPATRDLILRVWKVRRDDEMLFEGRVPGQVIDFRKAWERLTKEAGVPDLHMHDIRHVAAADLLRSGVTLGVAAQVLGHSPQILARRYGHLETQALRAAQEARWARIQSTTLGA